jgi:comEA protein
MLGFTRQEQQIILFLIFSLLIGSFIKIYKSFQRPAAIAPVEQSRVDAFREQAEALEQAAAEPPEGSVPSSGRGKTRARKTSPPPAPSAQPFRAESSLLIDINLAGGEELQAIPGIGPVLARRIIDYRTRIGAFGDIDELQKVKGIGAKTFEKIKPYVSLKTK